MQTIQLSETQLKVIKDPFLHIKHIHKVGHIPAVQKKIIRFIHKNPKAAIIACHGIGKTFTLGHYVPYFLITKIPSKILTTAPTNRQVNLLLWSEIRKTKENALVPLGGTCLETPHWKISPDHFAVGYSPEKGRENAREGEQNLASFQGIHSPNSLIVLEEATGIHRNIFTQMEGMLTGSSARVVAIGNPTTKNCRFYEICQSKSWAVLELSCFDSPNLPANGFNSVDDLKRELDKLLVMDPQVMRDHIAKYKVKNKHLISAQWVLTMALPTEWGIDSIPFKTRVLGQWPDIEEDAFFQSWVIRGACERKPAVDFQPSKVYIGVDPARFGTDNSSITTLEDYVQTGRVSINGKDTVEVARKVVGIAKGYNPEKFKDKKILVDATGVGAGVLDTIKDMKNQGYLHSSWQIVEIQFGHKPNEDRDNKVQQEKDLDKYFNKKAKIMDLLAKDMKNHLCLRDAEIYERELPGIIYFYNKKGQMQVESKDEYKARTGKPSPDNADSLGIANYGRYVSIDSNNLPRVSAL